jgi:hypothetical protein
MTGFAMIGVSTPLVPPRTKESVLASARDESTSQIPLSEVSQIQGADTEMCQHVLRLESEVLGPVKP